METLRFLQNRASIPAKLLREPAPDPQQVEEIIKAAVAAPDHCALRPWRFLIIEGDARYKLGDLFAEAARRREPDLDTAKIERQREKPLRSPMIITVIAKLAKDHEKVPEIEQLLSAGAAAQQALLAANALGFGAIWLTGPNAFDQSVQQGLQLTQEETIVGFLYLGTSSISQPTMRRPDTTQVLSYWKP